MKTINLTINGANASDLAHHLRVMALRIETGVATLPPGTEIPVHINNEQVGVITAGNRPSFEDGIKLAYAINKEVHDENIRKLDQAHEGLEALVKALRVRKSPPAQHQGLLTAIDIVGAGLREHSDSLREMLEKNANDA
ncbi:MAG: hypothetical protein U5L98_16390 [Halomonas sp.]|uniref:hypothetical protein n=1 Tax=Halomonas sp. TaxID=1486246 RepID=UPI002ACE9CC4|nr:hypothetical protein [Halomonas sp.]MDZ7854162.1 hypothetical protein [Halomonas sp.]